MYQIISAILIAVVTLGLSAWTAIATVQGGMEASVSGVLRAWGQEWIVLPYVWGVLFSHWWMGHERAITTPHGDLWITLGSMVVMTGIAAALRSWGVEQAQWTHAIVFGLGAVVGHYFWSQV